MMGSFVSVAVWSEDEREARERITGCFVRMQQVVSQISEWDPLSATSLLNRECQINQARCPDTLRALAAGILDVSARSFGAFHPLTGRLSALWRTSREANSLPEAAELARLLDEAKSSSLKVTPTSIAIHGSAQMETGGIGKGFVVDCGAEFLRASGIRDARIAASGDIRFLGNGPWEVYIEHPRTDDFLGRIMLEGDGAISTSGDYRNFFSIGNERFHHLIDINTGYPARYCQSATVIAPSGILADGLASAAFLLPPQTSLELLASIPRALGVIVTNEGVVQKSAQLKLKPASE
jgi:thiamine biosynthesis lipoprotein